MRKPLSRTQGFTLLELLVVVTLMAIVATVALVANDGVQDEATVDATKYEMAELRKALLQFRRDTGAFPNQGTYACADLQALAITIDAANGAVTWPKGAPAANTATWLDWCGSEANFWMLFIDPKENPETTAIENGWNPDTKRGWNGPYLTKSGPAFVDYDSIVKLRGVADSFTVGSSKWRLTPEDTELISNHGSPYLVFDLDDPTPSDDSDGTAPRIVSMGPDGGFAGPNTTYPCLPNTGSDDLVLCLLK